MTEEKSTTGAIHLFFTISKRTFMVTGGNLNEAKGGQAVVNIYEAENPTLTDGNIAAFSFRFRPRARTAECPNFFKLGDRWVLFVSPYGKVQYYVAISILKPAAFSRATMGSWMWARIFTRRTPCWFRTAAGWFGVG